MNKHVVVALCLVFLVMWASLGYYSGKKLRENHILTTGFVKDINGGGKGNFGPGIVYEYDRNGETVSSSRRHGELKYSIREFGGHYFPVIYGHNGLWYDDNILITPNDFEQYGYTFPDSLKWVLEYIDKD